MPTGFLLYRKSVCLLVIFAIAALVLEAGRHTVIAGSETEAAPRKQEHRIKAKNRYAPIEPAADRENPAAAAMAAVELASASPVSPQPQSTVLDKAEDTVPPAEDPMSQTVFTPVKSISVLATGYTAGIESTGKKPGHRLYGITRSGVKVKRGQVSTIAADTKVLPLGTLLYVPGYGYGVVADTGSKIKGKRIDLYFDTTSQVYKEWGKKQVTVQVLRYGSGKLDQRMLNRLNDTVKAGGVEWPRKM